jgi:hypothetical protein
MIYPQSSKTSHLGDVFFKGALFLFVFLAFLLFCGVLVAFMGCSAPHQRVVITEAQRYSCESRGRQIIEGTAATCPEILELLTQLIQKSPECSEIFGDAGHMLVCQGPQRGSNDDRYRLKRNEDLDGGGLTGSVCPGCLEQSRDWASWACGAWGSSQCVGSWEKTGGCQTS